MNAKQRKTLKAVFEKPVRKNIAWSDIEGLFIGLGAEIANKGGSVVTIKIGREAANLPSPTPRKRGSSLLRKKCKGVFD